MVVEAHERVDEVTDEVTDLHWPADAARRAELAGEGQPRLLIVAEGDEPPITADPLEDWVRPSADALEFYMRRDRLRRRAAARAPASIDADGLLHRGDRWVALPPGELAALTALMTEPGHMVARADLAEATSGPGRLTTSSAGCGSASRRWAWRCARYGAPGSCSKSASCPSDRLSGRHRGAFSPPPARRGSTGTAGTPARCPARRRRP